MKKIIVCLIFLISFANAIQCYNGKIYVDIPETKLSDIGYTKYNITHSNFDCKMAYKRYLKVKEIEPVNVSYITKSESENEKLEEHSKISYFLPILLLVIIIAVIWLIKNVIKDEPQEEFDEFVQKGKVKQKENDSVKKESTKFWDNLSKYSEKLERTEQFKSWNDLSKEYSENLIKLEEERQKKEKAYFDAILGKKNPVKTEEQVKSEDDSFDDYWNNILGLSDDDSENLRNPVKPIQKFNKTYDELLTYQEWYNFRNKVINDRGYVCEFCKKKHNLQVHHKLYYKKPDKEKIEPWLYNMDEVLLLCEDCHKSVHKKNKIKVYYISYTDYNKRKDVLQQFQTNNHNVNKNLHRI